MIGKVSDNDLGQNNLSGWVSRFKNAAGICFPCRPARPIDGFEVLMLPDGSTVLKTIRLAKQEEAHPANITNYRHFKKDWMSYSAIPVDIGKDQVGSLHIIFETMEADHIKAVFAIGLAIPKRIIKMHAGTIDARNQSDNFEIHIRFPVKST